MLDSDEWSFLTKRLLPDVFLQPFRVVLDNEGRGWFNDPNEGLFFIAGKKAVSLSKEEPIKGIEIDDLEAAVNFVQSR